MYANKQLKGLNLSKLDLKGKANPLKLGARARRALGKGGEKARGAGGAAARGFGRTAAKAANLLAEKAAQYAGNAVAGPIGGEIGKQTYKHRKAVTIIILIIQALPFLVLLFLIVGDAAQEQQNQQNSNSPLQITKTGPTQAKLGQTLNYNITVTYPGSAQDLVIIDPIPVGTTYVSSSPNGDWKNGEVTWDAKKLNLNLSNPINISVSLTVKATRDNTNVYNTATATIIGGSIGSGGNVPHNNSTCGGKYTLTSPFKNFGDPQCNFTKQAMGQEMKQLDPSNYYIWDCMAMAESGYNPNAYNPGSTSGFGAYGLLQMNPVGKGNGPYDNGSVNYPLQVSNAINYNNKVINKSFAYWATYAGCHH